MGRPRGTKPTDQTEASFQGALESLLRRGGLTEEGSDPPPVGVAVSGGGDSMALLAMTLRASVPARVATVDHGLRSEAAAEAQMVARYCADAGVAHTTLTIDDLKSGANLAGRARAARYDALAGWARDRRLRAVLLGHTRDDQAETFLLRLARGSGVDGLAAMAPARRWEGITWLRPLLDIDRADLRAWLTAHGIAWVEDPTNDDAGYDRVRVRQAMPDLAAVGLTAARLASTARNLARQRDVLEAAGANLARTAVRPGHLGEVYLDPAALRPALPDTSLRVLADVLIQVSGAPYRPRLEALEGVLTDLCSPDFRGATLSGCALAPHGDQIAVCREPAAIAPAPLKPDMRLWDGRWTVEGPADRRLWIAPLTEHGLQRATAALREAGLTPPEAWYAAPRAARRAVPAIYEGPHATPDELVAVPTIELVLSPVAGQVSIRAPSTTGVRQRTPE